MAAKLLREGGQETEFSLPQSWLLAPFSSSPFFSFLFLVISDASKGSVRCWLRSFSSIVLSSSIPASSFLPLFFLFPPFFSHGGRAARQMSSFLGTYNEKYFEQSTLLASLFPFPFPFPSPFPPGMSLRRVDDNFCDKCFRNEFGSARLAGGGALFSFLPFFFFFSSFLFFQLGEGKSNYSRFPPGGEVGEGAALVPSLFFFPSFLSSF